MYIHDFFQNFLKTFLVCFHGAFTSWLIAQDIPPKSHASQLLALGLSPFAFANASANSSPPLLPPIPACLPPPQPVLPPFLRRLILPALDFFPFLPLFLLSSWGTPTGDFILFFFASPGRSRSRRRQISSCSTSAFCCRCRRRCRLLLSWAQLRAHQAAKGNRRFELWARLMASLALVEVKISSFPSFFPT